MAMRPTSRSDEEMAPPARASAPSALPHALDGNIALKLALTSIAYHEGPRVGFLGDTRCGKSEAMKHFIAAYQRMCNGVVIVADDKDPTRPQFKGQCFRDRADLDARKPDPDGPRVLILRGDGSLRGGLNPEEVAALQFDLVKRRRPSLGVYDELDRAASFGQWTQNPSHIAWAFKQGAGIGAGSLWGAQETEDVPRQAFNQSTHIVCVRAAGNPIRLLKSRGYCIGGVDKAIPRLPGDELPPAQRGYFVLLVRGRPWDGHVYRFARPAP